MDRWQKCVKVASDVGRGFDIAAGHAYINKRFDREAKHAVSSLLERLFVDGNLLKSLFHFVISTFLPLL